MIVEKGYDRHNPIGALGLGGSFTAHLLLTILEVANPSSRQRSKNMIKVPQIAAREKIRHGGSAFLIEVSQKESGFRGEWTCATCVQGGVSAATYASAAAASAWAKMAAGVHYSVIHNG
jgi:hypothetical protein